MSMLNLDGEQRRTTEAVDRPMRRKWNAALLVPICTFVSGILVLVTASAAGISPQQLGSGWKYFAGLHVTFKEAPHIITYDNRPESDEVMTFECVRFQCPVDKFDAITEKYFGQDNWQGVERDANGNLTDSYIDKATQWQIAMRRAALDVKPGEFMNGTVAYAGADNRGSPALLIFLWLTIIGVAGSIVCVPLLLVRMVHYYRS